MKNILITGGTGLVGSRLATLLEERGYHVSILSRRIFQNRKNVYQWNLKDDVIENEAITSSDCIVHLAGAGVADARWSADRKSEIWNSRIDSSKLIFNKLNRLQHQVKAVISASAIGIYGDQEDRLITENNEPANDFLGRLSQEWESEVNKISELNIRTVNIRTGIVLSGKGGALPKMARPVNMFVGSALGPGSQYMSWIHIDDLCGIFIKAIEDESLVGPYNGVSPNPVTNTVLTEAIAKCLHKPLLLPNVPKFVLKIGFGEMARILLESTKASAEKILKTGFRFQYPVLESALEDIFS